MEKLPQDLSLFYWNVVRQVLIFTFLETTTMKFDTEQIHNLNLIFPFNGHHQCVNESMVFGQNN